MEGFRCKDIRVIYNGIEPPQSVPPYTIEPQPVISLVGRLNQQKGVDIFLEALRLLPECKGWLVGIGNETEQKRVVDQLQRDNLQSRVRWDQTGMEGVRAMTEAAVVVVPSRWEGLGIVALEAMSLGRPVVASRVDGLSEVVLEGVTGLLVAPESPEALAQAIRKILSDPIQASEMGQAGRRRVEEHFTLLKMRDAYRLLYEEILQPQPVKRAD
jgi:glycosyltransferase involved in cell wall biosynthesis